MNVIDDGAKPKGTPRGHSLQDAYTRKTYLYMWQSWVEIEHYFVAYFDHITAFEAL